MSGNNFLIQQFERRLSNIRTLILQGNRTVAEQQIKQLNDWILSFNTLTSTTNEQIFYASLQYRLRRFSVAHGISASKITGIPNPEDDLDEQLEPKKRRRLTA